MPPSPTQFYAFATGTVAMVLAHPGSCRSQSHQSNLKFGIAPAPTLPSTNVAWPPIDGICPSQQQESSRRLGLYQIFKQ